MAVVFTPITEYSGTVPNRTQPPASFNPNVQTMLDYFAAIAVDINVFISELTTAQGEIETSEANAAASAQQASSSAEESQTYASLAATNANFQGEWLSLSGSASPPYSVYHNGQYWQLLNSIANISASEPSESNPDWAVIQVGISEIKTPIAIAPLTGDTGVSPTPTLQASSYANTYGTARQHRVFEVDLSTGDFSSPVYSFSGDVDSHIVASALNTNESYKWRCQDIDVNNSSSLYMSVQSFATGTITINTPIITIDGSPSSVPESPVLTGSAFSVSGGSDTHLNTDWEIIRQSDAQTVWTSPADAVNLTTITVPSGILVENTTYIFKARYRGNVYGESAYGSETATTLTVFSVSSDELFSAWVESGTGSAKSVDNGLDMLGDGGMVDTKARTTTTGWRRVDTERGATFSLDSTSTSGQATEATGLTSFNADGASFGADADYNANGQDFVHYFWKKAPKFFDQTLINHTNGVQSDYDASTLGVVGMVEAKQSDGASDWFVWHKDLTVGNNLRLNTTAAESASNAYISVSGTTVSIDSAAPTGTYIVYMYAHDASAGGNIYCGTYTGNGSASGLDVALGFEVQELQIKAVDSVVGWPVLDISRGMVASGDDKVIYHNTTAADANINGAYPTATGFAIKGSWGAINGNGVKYIYKAVRRPSKVPTSGTEVFAVGQGDNVSIPGFESGFPVDLAIERTVTSVTGNKLVARLIQGSRLLTTGSFSASSESTAAFDYMDGWNSSSLTPSTYSWMFKRAPGFMDIIAHIGDGVAGKTENHNLQAVPEFHFTKRLDTTGNWWSYHSATGNTHYSIINSTAQANPDATAWNDTSPTDTQVTFGSNANVNASGGEYITVMFATLPGVSKVGSYTGNGTTQDIDCGFAAGARFILIKRTDSTSDWFLWDSLRGIVVGDDPHLSLNTTAAQVTNDDSIDPLNSGFTVNEIPATSINANGGTYIFLAIA